MELVIFLVGAVIVMLVIARRNGAFERPRHDDVRGSDVITPITPRGSVEIRDPRAQWRR